VALVPGVVGSVSSPSTVAAVVAWGSGSSVSLGVPLVGAVSALVAFLLAGEASAFALEDLSLA
jgi:hypothetical protein